MPLVYLDIILAKQVIAAALHNSTDLLSVLVVNFHRRPAVGAPASESRAVLANRVVSLNFKGVSSVFRNNLRFVLPERRKAALLAVTIFMFLNMANFLSVFPDDIGVRSVQEGARGRQQALELHYLLVNLNVITHSILL